MDRPASTRIRQLQQSLKLTGAIVWLSLGVLLPVLHFPLASAMPGFNVYLDS